MKYIDLHTHSTASDGSVTPAEVVRAAKGAGLSAVALSDHDTTEGVAEALAEGEKSSIEVIPAIELSSESKTETHILGYFIDPESEALKSKLEAVCRVRYEREEDVCRKLNALGFDVTMDEAREIAGDNILCRAHFAKIMTNKGYVDSVKEAFDLYLSNGRPAYSGIQALTDVEAVHLINDAGGIAFVAHLNQTRRTLDDLYDFLKYLKSEGLAGIEGYYTEYTPESGEAYRRLASRLGLLLSGGSDFHGAFKPHISIGRGTGDLRVPYDVLTAMKEYRDTRG
ncbi:MAG: PHP domain-containing protein [Firmicutes bacterium]|nr:PHP domain-containing protein [Bacillota bacterium]